MKRFNKFLKSAFFWLLIFGCCIENMAIAGTVEGKPQASSPIQSLSDTVEDINSWLADHGFHDFTITLVFRQSASPGAPKESLFFISFNLDQQQAKVFSKFLFDLEIKSLKGQQKFPGPHAGFSNQYGTILTEADARSLHSKLQFLLVPAKKPTKESVKPVKVVSTQGEVARAPAESVVKKEAIQITTPLALYNTLRPDSKEAMLIQRAALYSAKRKKEEDFNQATPVERAASVKEVLEKPNFQQIFNMFNKMLPVHRCGFSTLKGIAKLGSFVSGKVLGLGSKTEIDQDDVATLAEVFSNKRRQDLDGIIKFAFVSHIIEKNDPSVDYNLNFDSPNECKIEYGKPDDFVPCQKAIAQQYKLAEKFSGDKGDDEAKRIFEISQALLSVPGAGIGYWKDPFVGTDKAVFSVLGINRVSMYGLIVLPLEAELIERSWSTPVAATYFYRDRHHHEDLGQPMLYGAKSGRPWVSAKEWRAGGQEDFENSKIHGNRSILALVAAIEMLGRVVAYDHDSEDLADTTKRALKANFGDPIPARSFDAISPTDVRKYMTAVDSHNLIEVHLEPFSMDKIAKVVMTEGVKEMFEKASLQKQIPLDKVITVGANPQLNEAAEKVSAPQ